MLEPATVTANEMAWAAPDVVVPSTWSVWVPLPIVEGSVTEASRTPLASVLTVLRSFGVEKAHTSTAVLALNPEASTLTAVPA